MSGNDFIWRYVDLGFYLAGVSYFMVIVAPVGFNALRHIVDVFSKRS